LREQRHSYAPVIGAEHDIRKQLVAGEIKDPFAIAREGAGRNSEPGVLLQ
jgi:hypothetical protein